MKTRALLTMIVSFLGSVSLADLSSTNWMDCVDQALPLSQLAIPGTHNSGARFEPFPGTAACQALTIAEQLNAGVRFQDIRCRHRDDSVAIFHGSVNQKQRFSDLL